MTVKDDVIKSFGDDIILSGNAIVDRKVMTIPVSPSLDIILNGGIPEGSFVVLTGQPKCGKTTTSLDFCATAQKMEYAHGTFKDGRQVYYLNIEGYILYMF